MNIADKYMFEVKNKQFRFIPPKFDQNLFRNDEESIIGGGINKPADVNLEDSDLFPSETSKDQLYCYYNEIGECYKGGNKSNTNMSKAPMGNTGNLDYNPSSMSEESGENPSSMSYIGSEKQNSMNAGRNDIDKYIPMQPIINVPLPSDILKNFDLELDEEMDFDENRGDLEVNRIFSEIEANNPNVMSVFLDYQIPSSLAKVITKRIVKLSMQYYNMGDR
jgi:hypothetical protein